MAFIVISSILLMAFPSTMFIYHFVQQNHLMTEIVTLEKITEKFVNIATQRFLESQPKLETLSAIIEKEFNKPIQKIELVEFNNTFEINSDGIWRNQKTAFNGKKEAGGFFPVESVTNSAQKVQFLRIKKILDTFGAAGNQRLENVWFLSTNRCEVIFDKNYPNFVFEQKADNDYTQTPWVTYATPIENPNREIRFTPPLFDPVPKFWMVSAVYPLYVNGEFIGSLGEDMSLKGLLEFIFHSKQLYNNTQHFLIDKQGNFVLAGAWQKQLESLEKHQKFNFGDNENTFRELFKMPLTNHSKLLMDNFLIDSKRFVVIGMSIEPLGWHYFRLTPFDEIIEPTQKLFHALTLMIFLMSGLSGFLIFIATGSTITKRIEILTTTLNHYMTDHSVRLNHRLDGYDEIAEAAHAFDDMADKIEQSIHEQSAAEERLRLLTIALEQSPTSIIITDLEARLIYVNPQFTRVTGYEAHEVLNVNPRFLQSGLTPREIHLDLWETITSGNFWHGELINRRKNGEIYHEEAHIAPVFNDDNEITHYVGVKFDVTERKKAEKLLIEAKDAAEVATKAKSLFLANMSHEFRTPMNAIIGLSQLALSKKISPETHDYLERIKSSSDNLLVILNDILDFSKIEAGRVTLEEHGFNLMQLIKTVNHLFSIQTQEKNLEFQLNIAANIPENVIGDSFRLQQVLSNLVSNAIKFTQSGSVMLNVECETLEQPNVMLKFSVIDTGIGISEQDLSKLFIPFSQADSSITRRFGGTGLGLVICRDLLQLMNSELKINSQLNQGTVISFELPLMIDKFAVINSPKEEEQVFEKIRPITTFENTEQLKKSFTKLDNLLSENDFISPQLLDDIRADLLENEISSFNQIEKLIKNIDYENARHLLNQLIDLTLEND